MFKVMIGAAMFATLAACATGAATQSDAIRLSATKVLDTTTKTNEAGEEIICRKDRETGSRVRVKEICGTQAEWDRMDDENARYMQGRSGNRAEKST